MSMIASSDRAPPFPSLKAALFLMSCVCTKEIVGVHAGSKVVLHYRNGKGVLFCQIAKSKQLIAKMHERAERLLTFIMEIRAGLRDTTPVPITAPIQNERACFP